MEHSRMMRNCACRPSRGYLIIYSRSTTKSSAMETTKSLNLAVSPAYWNIIGWKIVACWIAIGVQSRSWQPAKNPPKGTFIDLIFQSQQKICVLASDCQQQINLIKTLTFKGFRLKFKTTAKLLLAEVAGTLLLVICVVGFLTLCAWAAYKRLEEMSSPHKHRSRPTNRSTIPPLPVAGKISSCLWRRP